jgi:hypothetical protein
VRTAARRVTTLTPGRSRSMAVRPDPFEGTDSGAPRQRPPPGASGRGVIPVAGRGQGGEALLCLTCNRVRPARNPAEYTVMRAYWITVYGLCTCAPPDAGV